jgi:hypothetical protein
MLYIVDYHMYSDVHWPSRLLYSIYNVDSHNAIQPTIIHNIFFIHGNQILGGFLILEVFYCLRPHLLR